MALTWWTHNNDLVMFMDDSLVSVRDSSRWTTGQFFSLQHFVPPGVGLGRLKGVDVDRNKTGIDRSSNPNMSNSEMNTTRTCLLFSNLILI